MKTNTKKVKWRRFFGISLDKIEDEIKIKKVANKDADRTTKNTPKFDIARDKVEIKEIIQYGIKENRDIDIAYVDRDNVKTERRITPHNFNDEELQAYCHLRQDKRTFLLDKILRAEMVNQTDI